MCDEGTGVASQYTYVTAVSQSPSPLDSLIRDDRSDHPTCPSDRSIWWLVVGGWSLEKGFSCSVRTWVTKMVQEIGYTPLQ